MSTFLNDLENIYLKGLKEEKEAQDNIEEDHILIEDFVPAQEKREDMFHHLLKRNIRKSREEEKSMTDREAKGKVVSMGESFRSEVIVGRCREVIRLIRINNNN